MSTHRVSKNLFKVPRCFCSTPRPHASAGCGATIPTRVSGRPTATEKAVYRAPLTVILKATVQLLAESFRLLPLAGCRTRLLRAWPHALFWARRCPPAKHPLGSCVSCVQCRCKYVVSWTLMNIFDAGREGVELGLYNGGVINEIVYYITRGETKRLHACEVCCPSETRAAITRNAFAVFCFE